MSREVSSKFGVLDALSVRLSAPQEIDYGVVWDVAMLMEWT
jgi:hypothetical protein